tara:strand:- start:420 stop:1259 length:840 start_codon:yes stop_codon:yes gene_type:complete
MFVMELSEPPDEIEELIASTTKLDLNEILCPICRDVFVYPRVYDCGHAVCETCMYEIDIRSRSPDTHTVEIHRCPVCRHPTLKSWNNRPLSFLIERIASTHPDYKKRKKEVIGLKDKRKSTLMIIPDTIDLAKECYNTRINLALDLYEILLEKLYLAAKEGKNHLIIKELAIVSEIEKVGDILSFQLFSNHNIYRLIVTRVECTIYLTRNAFIWRRNFENSGWIDPTDPTREEMSDNRPPPPPPPPPINSHSPLIHRRGYQRSNVSSPRSSNGGFSSRN